MRNPNEPNAPQPRDYLSTSEGTWRAISQSSPVCRNGERAMAEAAAARFKLDIAHGWIWNGDAGEWQVAP